MHLRSEQANRDSRVAKKRQHRFGQEPPQSMRRALLPHLRRRIESAHINKHPLEAIVPLWYATIPSTVSATAEMPIFCSGFPAKR